MKRIFALLFALLLVFSLAACSCGDDGNTVKTRTSSEGEWTNMY